MNSLTKNIRRSSIYSQGGISRMLAFTTFLANGLTPTATNTKDGDGKITTITLDGTQKTYVLEFDEDNAGFTQNLVVGNNKHIKQAITMRFSFMDEDRNQMVKNFDLGKHTFAVATKTGKFFLLGEQNGLVSETNDSGSGSAPGDLNGYNITVSGVENGRAIELTKAAWDQLIAAVYTEPAPEEEGGA